jgi:hypothetical protein
MVTDETFQSAMEYSFVATGIQPGKQLGELWYKSIWDLISDLLSLRADDVVLFWLYQREYTGLAGVFEVAESTPFFHNRDVGRVPGRYYPFRVLIRTRRLYEHIAPDDLLLADIKYLPWVSALSAKKALGAFGGRGRSSTPIPPWGVEATISALEEASSAVRWNEDKLRVEAPKRTCSYPFDGSQQRITVDVSKVAFPAKQPKYPGEVLLETLPASTPEGKFVVEKALEAWLMENIEDPQVCSILLEDPRNILWFANYFPCSVSGVNIDAIVVYEDSDGGIRISVVELKRDSAAGQMERTIDQLVRYVNVASRLLLPSIRKSYEANVKVEAAVCGFADTPKMEASTQQLIRRFESAMQVPLRVIGYKVNARSSTVNLTVLYP